MKLTKEDAARLTELQADLRQKHEDLQIGVRAFNEAMNRAWDECVADAKREYNEAVEELDQFRAQTYETLDAEWSEKSERWQESEKGQAARTFVDRFDEVSLAEYTEECPSDLDEPEEDMLHDVEGLPTDDSEF